MVSAKSARTESLHSVRDILEVFGAIDRAIRISKDDPEVLAVADTLLPGSVANPGWYEELERRYFPDDARTTPDLTRALTEIAKNDADGDTARLTRAQKTRLLYGISALARLNAVASKCVPDFNEANAAFGKALDESLAATAPASVESLTQRRATATTARGSFLRQASDNFTQPEDFDKVMRPQAEKDFRSTTTLLAPLCKTAVVTVDGYESAVIDTKFTSKEISLKQLKDIVNPFNWDEDYAELFVAMQAQTPEFLPDGWRRVLETVRLIGDETLTTPLKFYPYQVSPLELQMNYDLDMTNFGAGDGKVRVDRGFINMRSTVGKADQPGVIVTTRKVVHIEGISAFAQSKLVCIGGYGTASADFLLGSAAENAAKKLETPHPFYFPANQKQADADAKAEAAQATQATAAAPPATPMTHFVPAAVDAWTECAQDLTNGYFDVAQKWLSGSLTLTDLADYTTRISGELASSPWKYLQAMTTPRSPGKPGGAK